MPRAARFLATALLLSCVPRPDERPQRTTNANANANATPGTNANANANASPGTHATPSPEPPTPITLTVGGDVTLGYHYEEFIDEQLAKGTPPDEALSYGFRELRPLITEEELFLVNLECPFTTSGEKLPKNFNFRARPELVASLLAGGVDVVSLANNHLMDYSAQGLLDTIATLDAAGIAHFGAGVNLAQARRPAIVDWRGVRVAFLGYLFLGAVNIEPPEVHATAATPGVAGHPTDVAEVERMVREDVALARSQADLVVPYFHWGKERTFLPNPDQLRLARAAVQAGAHLVLGSHPHVLQGLELVGAVPVAYSLGNFVFGGNWNPKPKDSALYKARLSKAGYLSSELIPLQSDRYPERPAQPYPLHGDQAQALLQRLALFSSVLETPLPELPEPPPLHWVEPPPG